jgi:nitrile hydratase accessory protein
MGVFFGFVKSKYRPSTLEAENPVPSDPRSRDLPGIPSRDGEPVFREPWEAQAFAMTLALCDRGAFTWREWAATLAEEIRAAQAAGDPDSGTTYYRHWLAALEKLVIAKGLAPSEALASFRRAWGRAARRTPHGAPIALDPQDFSDVPG